MQATINCRHSCGFVYAYWWYSDNYSNGGNYQSDPVIQHNTCPICWGPLSVEDDRLDADEIAQQNHEARVRMAERRLADAEEMISRGLVLRDKALDQLDELEGRRPHGADL